MSPGGPLPGLDQDLPLAIALIALAATLVVGVRIGPLPRRQPAAGPSVRKPVGRQPQHLPRVDGARP